MPSEQTKSTPAEELGRMHSYYHQEIIELADAMAKRLGLEAVTKVVEEVIADRARRSGSLYAKQRNSHSVSDYLELIWEPVRAEGLEFTAELHENGVQICVTRCPVHDLACKINQREWFYHLVCSAKTKKVL